MEILVKKNRVLDLIQSSNGVRSDSRRLKSVVHSAKSNPANALSVTIVHKEPLSLSKDIDSLYKNYKSKFIPIINLNFNQSCPSFYNSPAKTPFKAQVQNPNQKKNRPQSAGSKLYIFKSSQFSGYSPRKHKNSYNQDSFLVYGCSLNKKSRFQSNIPESNQKKFLS
jgi:hypothetical protein